jgi:nitrite reductase/ring-hydroxylating ferredoxin subunit
MTHTIAREALEENCSLSFETKGSHYLVADIEGEIHAFEVTGPAASEVSRAIVAEGTMRCPMHGWPIDPDEGRCGTSGPCRYRRLPVELTAREIRIRLD